MKLFKKEKLMLFPIDGTLIPLSDVPDEAFCSGMLGIGFAVLPTAGTVYAPMTGRIESVTDARHAYTVMGDDGTELLVHVGIDTVTLGGKGFLPMVSEGDSVKAGDVLARVDLDVLREASLPLHTVVLITNPETVSELQICKGKGLGGKSEAARYVPSA
ncbi:MAG: PTS glucose transporter subunit IIA [Ruminococcaceae bacterium]|nr:PTS glucose transporter subunit IIA [Oscillospiraceae bacterium]